MRTELTVAYWKIKGVPFLGNMHPKTGMTEALTKYAEACKKKLDLAGKKARQDALKNVKAKLNKLKTDYPEKGNPLLWRSYIKPVDAALPREVQDFNDALARFQTQLAKSTNIEHYKAAMDMKVSGYAIGSAFWEAVKAEGGGTPRLPGIDRRQEGPEVDRYQFHPGKGPASDQPLRRHETKGVGGGECNPDPRCVHAGCPGSLPRSGQEPLRRVPVHF